MNYIVPVMGHLVLSRDGSTTHPAMAVQFDTLTQRILSEESKLYVASICPTMDVLLLSTSNREMLKLWRVAGEAGNVWTKSLQASWTLRSFAWSPNGQLLAVTSDSDDFEESALELCSVNDGQILGPRRVFPREAGAASSPKRRKKDPPMRPCLVWLEVPSVPRERIQVQELIQRLPALSPIAKKAAVDKSNPASM